jgi:hypothetical protein
MPRGFVILCSGLVTIIVVTTALFIIGATRAATMVSAFTYVWMFGFLAYVVLWDSRKRWRGEPWRERFMRIITFTR